MQTGNFFRNLKKNIKIRLKFVFLNFGGQRHFYPLTYIGNSKSHTKSVSILYKDNFLKEKKKKKQLRLVDKINTPQKQKIPFKNSIEDETKVNITFC